MPAARLQARGSVSYFGLPVYELRLWVTENVTAETFEHRLLALEIEYARALDGRRIAERSLAEMQRVDGISDEQAQRWLAAMTQAFPEVARGDRLTGVQRPREATHFFFNTVRRGEIRDAEFTRRFFGIWLGPRSSEPGLRATLLGLPRAAS